MSKQEKLRKILYYSDMHPNDCQFIQDLIDSKDKEIERLNNIINGMEKFFMNAYINEVRPFNDKKVSVWTICLEKLQELKGDRINEISCRN